MMQVADCYKYVEDIKKGNITACRWVKLACQRFENDFNNPELYFDEDAAQIVLDFIGCLTLWKGKEYKGKPFILAPHFIFIICNLFGWKLVSTGYRRYRTAYIEVGRKSAKSTLAGAIGAYMFAEDDEEGNECYSAAVKKDQAKIVWTNIRNLLKNSIFAEDITFHTNNLFIERTWSKCEPLSSDSKSLDGLDTHFASLDELHAHPTPAVHDLIDDSTGARSQSLILIITTAGFDQSGICFQRREYLTQLLKGTIEDDTFFGMIFTLDTKKDWPKLLTTQEIKSGSEGEAEDNWQNEDCWIKSLPGLCGVTASGKRFGVDKNGNPIPGYMTKIEDVRKKVLYAISQPAAINNVLTKRFNCWVSQATRWLDLDLWDANYSDDIYIYE